MIELRLRSGQIVAFDGRVVEVFDSASAAERIHVAQAEAVSATDSNGGSTIEFRNCSTLLRFAREEAPARARLLAAIESAREADAPHVVPSE
jgi:hypothetical protein